MSFSLSNPLSVHHEYIPFSHYITNQLESSSYRLSWLSQPSISKYTFQGWHDFPVHVSGCRFRISTTVRSTVRAFSLQFLLIKGTTLTEVFLKSERTSSKKKSSILHFRTTLHSLLSKRLTLPSWVSIFSCKCAWFAKTSQFARFSFTKWKTQSCTVCLFVNQLVIK